MDQGYKQPGFLIRRGQHGAGSTAAGSDEAGQKVGRGKLPRGDVPGGGCLTGPTGRSARRDQRYLAAVMNWEKASHQTTTVVYAVRSVPGGIATRKPLKVLTAAI